MAGMWRSSSLRSNLTSRVTAFYILGILNTGEWCNEMTKSYNLQNESPKTDHREETTRAVSYRASDQGTGVKDDAANVPEINEEIKRNGEDSSEIDFVAVKEYVRNIVQKAQERVTHEGRYTSENGDLTMKNDCEDSDQKKDDADSKVKSWKQRLAEFFCFKKNM